MYGGLIRDAGSHHGRPVHEYFLEKYGHSVYANYVRYTLGTDILYPYKEKTFYRYMMDITSKAPMDFPLLADTYVKLLEYYKNTGELDKMAELSNVINLENLNVVDPRLLEQLTNLINHFAEVESRIHFKDHVGRTSLHNAAENGPPRSR